MERCFRLCPVVTSGCLAIALWLTGVGASAAVSSESAARCANCRTTVTRQLVRSRRIADCHDRQPSGRPARVRRALARLERMLARCARDSVCGGLETPLAQLGALQGAVGSAQADVCASAASEGAPIDPTLVQGPVGLAPAGATPATASLDEIATHCRWTPHDVPPLLALPEIGQRPEWCSEEAAYWALVARCGTPRVVVVAAGSDPAGATGTAGHPYPTIAAGLAACGSGPCHVLVAPGTYAEGVIDVRRCVFLEGGFTLSQGILTSGGPRPHIEGTLQTRRGSDPIAFARLHVEGAYGALMSEGDVLVSGAVLRGGYEGGGSAWDAEGPRVCGTHVAGSYSGLSIAWHSRRLWIAGSAIAACHEGVSLSWGSQGLRLLDSIVYGRYPAVDLSWGSSDALVRGSRLVANLKAVSVDLRGDEQGVIPETFDVTITGNRVTGTLPASDPARNIVVEGNVQE